MDHSTLRPGSGPGSGRLGRPLRRRVVRVPTEIPGSEAVFLVLRRMRLPLIVLVTIFAVSVTGLSLMPGMDDNGNPHRLTLFDSFYVMSYTATTIGFGEIPYAFSYAQRMWVTLSIYLTVIGWAYAISALFSLVQDAPFREAISVQRLRRKIRDIGEPFLIVTGYGQAGRAVCRTLDDLGRRFVVIDDDQRRVDALAVDQHRVDVPGIDGAADNPALLGLAGLGHPRCEGVLALASDEVNLSVVMTVHLLRPEIPVLARAEDRRTANRMLDFDPVAVINPLDRYGSYLVLALQRPVTFQLATWLMDAEGSTPPERMRPMRDGRWVVIGDTRFATEVAHDLENAGLTVEVCDVAEGNPDVTGAVGLVAGAESDVENLALAAHARLQNPELFISLRQRSVLQSAAVKAFDADSLFVPSDLVAREMLARVISPAYWSFIDHVLHSGDDRAGEIMALLVERFGRRTPASTEITLDHTEAPAVARWLGAGRTLTVGQLLADPDDRSVPVSALVIALVRDGETRHLPADDTELHAGDVLLVAGRQRALDELNQTLFYDHTVEYSATGETVPETWLWRVIRNRRQSAPR
ncbi:potassium transporter [Enemella dayhoffiae]|uniref:Potassium transporter n=1 Tax=Enemella dayhoffiae TaxID=2016507 RepID=A0A255HAP1_9ACTN|nr:potassium channel protein [Enemella dayhoffiae]OYO24677.1 potassium transporter [Enemella dayhoffiae]